MIIFVLSITKKNNYNQELVSYSHLKKKLIKYAAFGAIIKDHFLLTQTYTS